MIDLQLAPNVDHRPLPAHPVLRRVRRVGVYSQILFGHQIVAPNHNLDIPAWLADLSAAGVQIGAEVGAVKAETADDHFLQELVRLVAKCDGALDAVLMDEPLRYTPDRTNEDIAQAIARWIRKAHDLGVRVTWIEGTPHVDWLTRMKPVLSRVWELAPFDELRLDIDGRATWHFTELEDAHYRSDLVDLHGWVEDRRHDHARGLLVGVTLISPSLPRIRAPRDRLAYAMDDPHRRGFRQAWADGKYRPCESLSDFRASVADQQAILPFAPDVWDYHSWEANPDLWPDDGYPKTLPTFSSHVQLIGDAA